MIVRYSSTNASLFLHIFLFPLHVCWTNNCSVDIRYVTCFFGVDSLKKLITHGEFANNASSVRYSACSGLAFINVSARPHTVITHAAEKGTFSLCMFTFGNFLLFALSHTHTHNDDRVVPPALICTICIICNHSSHPTILWNVVSLSTLFSIDEKTRRANKRTTTSQGIVLLTKKGIWRWKRVMWGQRILVCAHNKQMDNCISRIIGSRLKWHHCNIPTGDINSSYSYT